MSDLPYPEPTSDGASAVMRANTRVDTKPETLVRSRLHRQGLRFRKDMTIRVDDRVTRPDIVFTKQKLAVYVDGCFWHQCPEHGNVPDSNRDYWVPKLKRNVERDRANTDALESDGWTVCRFWEHVPAEEAASKIVEVLNQT